MIKNAGDAATLPSSLLAFAVFWTMSAYVLSAQAQSNCDELTGGLVIGCPQVVPPKVGQRSGSGKFTLSNGETYEGSLENNLFNGKGEYTWTNGAKYVGFFSSGKLNGKGTYTYGANRSVGDWVDSQKN